MGGCKVLLLMRVLMGSAAIFGGIALVSIFILEDDTLSLTVLTLCLLVLIVGGLAGADIRKD